MIDMHCHILPNLDDGAETMEEAVEMARHAVRDGITGVVATPHCFNGIYKNEADCVKNAVQQFQKELAIRGIPLIVYPGAEIHLHYELVKNLKESRILTMGSNTLYVLIELPHLHLPVFTDQLFDELLDAGFKPILAHPERNFVMQKQRDRLQRLVNKGVLTQITAGSLLGKFGRRIRRISKELVKQNLVHFLGSDGHSLKKRPIELASAYKQLEDWTDRSTAVKMKQRAYAVIEESQTFK